MRTIERPWNDADTRELRKLWSANAPSSLIANMLYRSRSSVCGKVSRLKLKREKKPILPTKARVRSRQAKAAQPLNVSNAPMKFGSIESYAPKPVPFLKAKQWHCRAVLDEKGRDGLALFCGARAVRGHAWCEHHLIRFTTAQGRA